VPSRADHIARAEENEAFAKSLDQAKPLYVDWGITVLFYSALHYVDAYLAIKPLHPPNLDARDTAIQNNGSLSPIYKDYRRLKDQSRAARYEIPNFDRSQFSAMNQRFENIKTLVLSKMG
jgi:hypothetical protein